MFSARQTRLRFRLFIMPGIFSPINPVAKRTSLYTPKMRFYKLINKTEILQPGVVINSDHVSNVYKNYRLWHVASLKTQVILILFANSLHTKLMPVACPKS